MVLDTRAHRDAPPVADVLAQYFPAILAVYFALQFVRRLSETHALGLDEAEQIIMTQAYAWGYGSQPPLYSWLQRLLSEGLGRSIASLAVLHNLVLFLTFFFVFLAAEETLRDRLKAAAVAFSLFFIPQIAWESQRALVHTPLVVCSAAATLLCFLHLVRTRRLPHYVLFGFAVAAGVLAKYNYVVFIVALLFAAVTTATGRRAVFDWRMFLVSLPLTLACTAPTLVWSYAHWDLVTARVDKFAASPDIPFAVARLGGIGTLLGVTIAFSALCVGIYALAALPLRRRGSMAASDSVRSDQRRIVVLTPLVCLAILALFMLATGATAMKDRWLQPYLFLLPLVCFILLEPWLGRTRQIAIGVIGGVLALVCMAMLVVYNHQPALWKEPSTVTAPFDTLAQQVGDLGFTAGTIVSPRSYVGGNLAFRFSAARGLTGEYRHLPGPFAPPFLLAWTETLGPSDRQSMDAVLLEVCRARLPMQLDPVRLEAPYDGDDDRMFKLNVQILPACPI